MLHRVSEGSLSVDVLASRLRDTETHIELLKRSVATLETDISKVAILDDPDAADFKRKEMANSLQKAVGHDLEEWQDFRMRLALRFERMEAAVDVHADQVNRAVNVHLEDLAEIWDVQPSFMCAFQGWGGNTVISVLFDTIAAHVVADGTVFVSCFEATEFRTQASSVRMLHTVEVLEDAEDAITTGVLCGRATISQPLLFLGTKKGVGMVVAFSLEESTAPQVLARRAMTRSGVHACGYSEDSGNIVIVSGGMKVTQWSKRLEALSVQTVSAGDPEISWGRLHMTLGPSGTIALLVGSTGVVGRVHLPQQESEVDDDGRIVAQETKAEILIRGIWVSEPQSITDGMCPLFPRPPDMPEMPADAVTEASDESNSLLGDKEMPTHERGAPLLRGGPKPPLAATKAKLSSAASKSRSMWKLLSRQARTRRSRSKMAGSTLGLLPEASARTPAKQGEQQMAKVITIVSSSYSPSSSAMLHQHQPARPIGYVSCSDSTIRVIDLNEGVHKCILYSKTVDGLESTGRALRLDEVAADEKDSALKDSVFGSPSSTKGVEDTLSEKPPPVPKILPKTVMTTDPDTMLNRELDVANFAESAVTTALAVDPEGKILFSGNEFGEGFVWDLANRQVVALLITGVRTKTPVTWMFYDQRKQRVMMGVSSGWRLYDVASVVEHLCPTLPSGDDAKSSVQSLFKVV